MKRSRVKRKPYSERSDLEKIRSGWKKVNTLYNKSEWSSVVVRVATTVELAINLAIREELSNKRELETQFVDSLLIWANGIQGKMDKLFKPLLTTETDRLLFSQIRASISDINDERNSVAHGGQFKKKTTATRIMRSAKEVIEKVVARYDHDLTLDDID